MYRRCSVSQYLTLSEGSSGETLIEISVRVVNTGLYFILFSILFSVSFHFLSLFYLELE